MSIDNPTLTTVYLVGSLGKAMGREVWHLDVSSVAEAIRAINANTRGKLEEYLKGPARNKPYKVALQKKTNLIDKEELCNKSGRSTIYIIPTIRGRKSGPAKIIAGIVLMVVGFVLAPVSGGSSLSLAKVGSTLLVAYGASLTIGGITQMLARQAKPSTAAEVNASNIFQGNSVSVIQGSSVPLIYGRVLVSPIPVAITVDNDDRSTPDASENREEEGRTQDP